MPPVRTLLLIALLYTSKAALTSLKKNTPELDFSLMFSPTTNTIFCAPLKSTGRAMSEAEEVGSFVFFASFSDCRLANVCAARIWP